jgi:hypothetical protein
MADTRGRSVERRLAENGGAIPALGGRLGNRDEQRGERVQSCSDTP